MQLSKVFVHPVCDQQAEETKASSVLAWLKRTIDNYDHIHSSSFIHSFNEKLQQVLIFDDSFYSFTRPHYHFSLIIFPFCSSDISDSKPRRSDKN
jgi:hypothetical protein